jgi:hypothetical protein
MRGDDEISGNLFSYIDLEQRVRADHPLRAIRKTNLRGGPKVDWAFTFAAAAYNLVQAPKLIAAVP